MTDPIGIVDLVGLCEQMEQRNLALFRALGERVADEAEPVTQRWFAVASHRHAWHAELWDERRPRIPIETDGRHHMVELPHETSYRQEIDQLLADLEALSARLDPALDPSTARVISLVRADLLELAHD